LDVLSATTAPDNEGARRNGGGRTGVRFSNDACVPDPVYVIGSDSDLVGFSSFSNVHVALVDVVEDVPDSVEPSCLNPMIIETYSVPFRPWFLTIPRRVEDQHCRFEASSARRITTPVPSAWLSSSTSRPITLSRMLPARELQQLGPGIQSR
jgi:hypothetical protein